MLVLVRAGTCEHRAGTRPDDHQRPCFERLLSSRLMRESMVSLAVLPGWVWPASDAMASVPSGAT